MAWTTPGTAVAGDVLTAAFWNSNVRDNSLMGNPVFTTEAARDAAITSPVEGQTCYLTAPTIPAATGQSTYLPTGVRTIYNGSVWVCVTPIGAQTVPTGTNTSTSYTTTLGGTPGTNPSVTLVTGTTAMISISADIWNTTTSAVIMSVSVSGAGTVAANDDMSIYLSSHTANNEHQMGSTHIMPGLTAGTNTFTLSYRVTGGTGNYYNRRIAVHGIA